MAKKTIHEKRKERQKQTAEVFTPDWLAQQMLDKIPEGFWLDPNKTLLEPSCGDGIFVILSIEKRLKYGHSIRQAIENTYAVDIMKDNIEICRGKVFQLIVKELYREFNKKKNEILSQYYSNDFVENKLDELIQSLRNEIVELSSIMIHNIFRVKDTLTFDFEKFRPWDELPPHIKKSHNQKVTNFLTRMGYQ